MTRTANPHKPAAWMALLLATLALLAACVPEQKVSWSPDGTRALLIAGDGLHLMQPDGTLSPVLMKDANSAQWIGTDTALVVQMVQVKSWAQAKQILAPEDLQAAQNLGAYGLLRLKQIKGSGEAVGQELSNDPVFRHTPMLNGYALLYALDQDPSLATRLGLKPDQADAGVAQLQAVRIANDQLTVTRTLAVGGPFGDVRLNPVSDWLLFTQVRLQDETYSLGTVPLDGGDTAWLADHVARNADWTADGRSVVFVGTQAGLNTSSPELGQLERLTVLSADGTLLKEKDRTAGGATRVGVSDFSDVRHLADGRIAFTSMPLTVPGATDRPPQPQLYVLSTTGELATVQLADGAEGVLAFSIDPTGKTAAILTEKTVQVARLDGPGPYTCQVLGPAADSNDVSSVVPAWRHDEVTWAMPTDQGRQLVRQAPGGKPVILSANWNAPVRGGLLDKSATDAPEPASTTTHPAPTTP